MQIMTVKMMHWRHNDTVQNFVDTHILIVRGSLHSFALSVFAALSVCPAGIAAGTCDEVDSFSLLKNRA